MNNPVAFHAEDGWGYRFLADLILKVDPLNPALSARLGDRVRKLALVQRCTA